MSNSLDLVSSAAINPVTFPAIAGQPVSSPVIGVNGSGWVAAITLTGITDPTQICDGTKLTLVVTDPGFDRTGTATTVTRTIVGVAVLKRLEQDPLYNQSQGSNPNNNVNYQQNVVGGNLVIHVVLDDWVYAGSTIVSASIASGFYPGVAAGSLTATNHCDLTYPNPIFSWYSPHYLSTAGTNSLYLESVVFHRHAMNGQQVACVKYQATDAHGHSGAIVTVPTSTLSTIAKVGNKPEVWAANVDFTGLTQGDTCTVNAIVYPWIGVPYALANFGSIVGSGISWNAAFVNDPFTEIAPGANIVFGTGVSYWSGDTTQFTGSTIGKGLVPTGGSSNSVVSQAYSSSGSIKMSATVDCLSDGGNIYFSVGVANAARTHAYIIGSNNGNGFSLSQMVSGSYTTLATYGSGPIATGDHAISLECDVSGSTVTLIATIDGITHTPVVISSGAFTDCTSLWIANYGPSSATAGFQIRNMIGTDPNRFTQRGQTLMHAFCDNTGAYGGAIAYVNPATGNDSTGVVSKTAATARAMPFANISTAAAAIKSFNNAHSGHNDLGGGIIRCMDNNGSPQTVDMSLSGSGPGGLTWCYVETDPQATAEVTLNSGYLFMPNMVYVRNFSWTYGGFTWYGNNNVTDITAVDNIKCNNTGGRLIGWWGIVWTYNITTMGSRDPSLMGTDDPTPCYRPVISTIDSPSVSINLVSSGLIIGCNLQQNTFYPYQNMPRSGFNGGGFSENDGNIIYNNKFNQFYALNGQNQWAQNTFYYASTIIFNLGNYYYASVGGTSASSGTGPTGTTPPTDGAITWVYIGTELAFPLGFAIVQNLFEVYQTGTGTHSYSVFNDGDVTWINNFIDMHNLGVGGKCNTLYNDFPPIQFAPSCIQKQGTRKFTVIDDQNCKTDGSPGIAMNGGCGNYAFAYGVGNEGPISLFGEVNRGSAVLPTNTITQPSYLGLAWHPTAIPNLQNVVSKLLHGGSVYQNGSGQDPYAQVSIMEMFANFTTGPWGSSGIFPAWSGSTVYNPHDTCTNAGNFYITTSGGTSGGTAPVHTSGTVSDGGVAWTWLHGAYALGGDYTPVAGSLLTSRVGVNRSILQFDLYGRHRLNNGLGAAGPIEALTTSPTFSISPSTTSSSNSITITATGTNTDWRDNTTFSVSGGTGASISNVVINVATQTVTFTLNPGTQETNLTIHDSRDTASAVLVYSSGDDEMAALSWDATFTPDAIFAGLNPVGLVRAGQTVIGDIKSQVNRTITQATFQIVGRNGVQFDPGLIYAGFVTDIDGTNAETPITADNPGNVGESIQPVGVQGFVPSVARKVSVLSSMGATVRLAIINKSGVDVIVNPLNYKQA